MSDPLRSTLFLRRLLERGVLKILGGASLVAGISSVPLLLGCGACSPPHTVVHAVPLMSAMPRRSDEEAYQAFCYEACGVTDDCYAALWHPDGQIERTPFGSAVGDRVGQPLGSGVDGQPEEQESAILVCVETVQQCQGIGRNPSMLAAEPSRHSHHETLMGEHFARIAHLEAAAVLAFVELSFELEAHGAPVRLVHAAQRSAIEEIRHHRDTASLAMALGSKVTAAEAWLSPPRTLDAVLRTNRLEGGLGEALGAYVATTQGKRALSPRVRSLMATIGREETGHAQLSFAIHRWGNSQLTPYQARALRRDGSASQLALSAAHTNEPALRRVLGLPNASEIQAHIALL